MTRQSFHHNSPGGIPPVPLSRRKRLVGLDLGTSKVVVVIAEADDYGQLNVTGVGETPAEGLRKGVVVNIDKTVQSIQHAMVGAERFRERAAHLRRLASAERDISVRQAVAAMALCFDQFAEELEELVDKI